MLLSQQQLHLFSLSSNHGNTLLDYDLIPKYIHDRSQKKISIEEYEIQGDRDICLHQVEHYLISPAVLKNEQGKLMAIYPGTRESLVEECLINFAKNGEFILAKGEPGYRLDAGVINIYFSMYQLLKELKSKGKEYNTKELDEALMVLQKATYQYKTESSSSNNIKQRLFDSRHYINRYSTIENKEPSDKLRVNKIVCVALSHEATKRILEGKYRSYDAQCSLRMKSPISRYLYKQLTQEWMNANIKGESGAYLEVFQNESILASGCPLVANPTKRKVNFLKALNELVDNHIIQVINKDFDVKRIKQGRKIVDVSCIVRPTSSFVSQQIKGHIRFKLTSSLGVQVKGELQSKIELKH